MRRSARAFLAGHVHRRRVNTAPLPLIISLVVGLALGGAGGYLAASRGKPTASAAVSPSVGSEGSAPAEPGSPAQAVGSAPATPDAQGAADAPQPITAAELKAELQGASGLGFGVQAMRKWNTVMNRLMVSDPGAIAAEMVAASGRPNYEEGWHLVMAAYAEKDPTGAWKFATGLKDARVRQMAIFATAGTLATKDPGQAIALLETIAEPETRRQVKSTVMMSIAAKDPQRALDLALADGDAGEDDFSVNVIFSQWATKDPAAAKAALGRLSGRQAERARSAVVTAMAQTDPAGALRFAETLPKPEGRYGDPRTMVIDTWSQSDPAAALKAAGDIADPAARNQALSSAVRAWSRNDPEGALQYAVAVDDSVLRSDLLVSLSQGANSENRRKIFDAVIEHMPMGDNFRSAVNGLFSGWARENPVEAAAALQELPAGRIQSDMVSQIARGWAGKGQPEEALAWVRNLPDGESKRNAMAGVLGQWASEDPQAVLNVLPSVPADQRKQAVRQISQAWSRRDPQGALSWAATLTNEDERKDATRDAVGQWAEGAPEEAARFARNLPENVQGPAVGAAVDRWASKDAEAAAEWLATLPAGTTKDAAIPSLARKIAGEDPEAALSWALAVSKPESRNALCESLARDWMRHDPAGARNWVGSSSLPPETKTRLLK